MGSALLNALGLGLLHSLWLGTLAYLGVRTLLPLLPRAGQRLRLAYGGLGLTGLGFLLAIPLSYGLPTGCAEAVGSLNGWFPGLGNGPTQPRFSVPALPPAAPPYLAFAYLIGLPIALRALFGQYLSSRFLGRRGTAAPPASWAMADRPGPEVRLSEYARGVMTVGLRRPVVLFSHHLAEELTPAAARTLLLHELAHLRYGDHRLNYAQQLMSTLLFFHPAVGALSRLIEREREYRCDDFVVARTPDRRLYAAALVTAARRPPANRLVLAATGSDFSRRVHRLFGKAAPPRNRFLWGGLFVAFLAAGLTLAPYVSPQATDCPGAKYSTVSLR